MPRRNTVRASLPSLDTLEDIAARAAGGDNAALEELGKVSEKLNRRLNQRMRELEKADRTGDAYQRIKSSLGGKARGSQARTGSAEQLFKNAQKALRGLNYKESTLSGIREVDQETADSFFRHFGLLREDQNARREDVKRLNRFLGSDGWREMKKAFGSDIGKQISEMILNDEDDIESFLSEMENFENLDTDIFTTLEAWGVEF